MDGSAGKGAGSGIVASTTASTGCRGVGNSANNNNNNNTNMSQQQLRDTQYILGASATRLVTDRRKAISHEMEPYITGQEAKLIKHFSRVLYLSSTMGEFSDIGIITHSLSSPSSSSSSSTLIVNNFSSCKNQPPATIISSSHQSKDTPSSTTLSPPGGDGQGPHLIVKSSSTPSTTTNVDRSDNNLALWLTVVNISPNCREHVLKSLILLANNHPSTLSSSTSQQQLQQSSATTSPTASLSTTNNNHHLYALIHNSDNQLKQMALRFGMDKEDQRRFVTATKSLREYTTKWISTGKEPNEEFSTSKLCWMSYDKPARSPNEEARRSISESGMDSGASDSGLGSNVSQGSLPTGTPPPSPAFPLMGNSLTVQGRSHSEWTQMTEAAQVARSVRGVTPDGTPRNSHKSSSSTPPPTLKWGTTLKGPQTLNNGGAEAGMMGTNDGGGMNDDASADSSSQAAAIITRSHSHESNLQHRIYPPKRLGSATNSIILPPPPCMPTPASAASSHTSIAGVGTAASTFTTKSSTLHFHPHHHYHPHHPHHQHHYNSASLSSSGGTTAVVKPSSLTISRGSDGGDPGVRAISPEGDSDIFLSPTSPALLASPTTIIESTNPHLLLHHHSSSSRNNSISSNIYGSGKIEGSIRNATGSVSGVSSHVGGTTTQAPRSPRTSGRIFHNIPHNFKVKKFPSLSSLSSLCPVCKKSITLRKSEKCKSCKMIVHSECKSHLSDDTCGLTKQHVKSIIGLLTDPPPHSDDTGGNSLVSPHDNGAGEGSSSSCNSSAPSTPAPLPFQYLSRPLPTSFPFPDLKETPEITIDNPDQSDRYPKDSRIQSGLVNSQDSQSTVKEGSSNFETGSEQTLSQGTDEYGSQNGSSNGGGSSNLVDTGGSGGSSSNGGTGSRSMERNSWSQSSEMRTTWKEVTVTTDSIRFAEPKVPIGHGMFGRTYKGYRHQDVAVKFLHMNHVHPDNQVEAFKNEVNCYKHTRHEKLVLFLGYCLEPGNLAIVLNHCDGKTLHQLIHLSPGRMDPNKSYEIAVQITQGMSYLHGKKICHKDLRGKNVFVEPTGKVVITDFGLFSMRRLIGASSNSIRGSKYRVPDHWLCYLAPELIRSIRLPESRRPLTQDDYVSELPFTFASDVYAFGSVWFEMVTGEFPFKHLEDEGSIIYQVGEGIQPPLPPSKPHVKVTREILKSCWNYKPEKRLDFNEIVMMLERIPRKGKVTRSPSHPISLSRSAESMF